MVGNGEAVNGSRPPTDLALLGSVRPSPRFFLPDFTPQKKSCAKVQHWFKLASWLHINQRLRLDIL